MNSQSLQDKIKAHFERLYQEGNTPWYSGRLHRLFGRFLDELKERFGQAALLDLGCGNGWVGIVAAQAGHHVWGIDSSPTAIRQAKQLAEQAGVARQTHFQLGDALALPFADRHFDGLIDRGLLHHIVPGNYHLYFNNIVRVLKPGSLLYLEVFSTENEEGLGQHLFTMAEVARLFGDYFRVIASAADQQTAPAHLLHFILERYDETK